jgi:hypothetical protein
VNVESLWCQRTVPPVPEEVEPTNDLATNQGEVANVLVEVSKNAKGMEWKVSEGMPVHLFGYALNSGDCYIPPNRHSSAGGKRGRRDEMRTKCDCNHKDEHPMQF